ncbi:PucR family transcriptional regulator [Brassicibacter mesophilus]|uniref:PucR family transcriptional regulator n=1 Tax=Brassicibacter mesophilus TaxID=745119 RepID=UPI003D197194
MKLTVEKLLLLDAYRGAKLVGGSKGINKEVTGITIIEDITIGEWLKGGEILITSLLPFKDYSENEIVSFFTNLLISKNLSAIIIKVGKIVSEIPARLIEWGNEKSVPIIEIPRDILYTDIMYPAMAEVMKSQVNKLTYFKSVHEKFRDMAIRNYPIIAVIKALSDIINNPVEIYDKNYNLMHSTLEEPIGITINSNFTRSQLGRGIIYLQKNNDDGSENANKVIVEISALENTKAYLSIVEINKKVDDMDLIAIENACTNISLIMAKDIAVKEVEERFMNDIVNDLIFGSPNLNNSLIERANIAGIDLYGSYSIVVLNFKYNLNNIKNSLKNFLGLLVKQYNGVYSLKNDHVIIFVKLSENGKFSEVIQDIKQRTIKLMNLLEKKYPQICFSGGIGNKVNGFESIRKSYNEAVEAANVGLELYGENIIISYDELGIFKLIRDISLNRDISEYIPKTIIQLRDIDSSKNKELLKTLEVYIKNNRNLRITANELFIHPKTVSYRIGQIKDITEIDFDDYDKLLEIQFAIKILKFLKRNN